MPETNTDLEQAKNQVNGQTSIADDLEELAAEQGAVPFEAFTREIENPKGRS